MYEKEMTVEAFINGETIKSEKHEARENPAHPDQIAGFFRSTPRMTQYVRLTRLMTLFRDGQTWRWTNE